MKRAADRLTINPYFYDVLSGEFKAQCDSVERTHTLGRLAIATFKKGVALDDHPTHYHDKARAYSLDYIPSWAPGYKSIAIAHWREGVSHLTSLALRDSDSNSLIITDERVLDDEDAAVRIEANGLLQLENFNLESIASMQEHIAELATDFFQTEKAANSIFASSATQLNG